MTSEADIIEWLKKKFSRDMKLALSPHYYV